MPLIMYANKLYGEKPRELSKDQEVLFVDASIPKGTPLLGSLEEILKKNAFESQIL